MTSSLRLGKYRRVTVACDDGLTHNLMTKLVSDDEIARAYGDSPNNHYACPGGADAAHSSYEEWRRSNNQAAGAVTAVVATGGRATCLTCASGEFM